MGTEARPRPATLGLGPGTRDQGGCRRSAGLRTPAGAGSSREGRLPPPRGASPPVRSARATSLWRPQRLSGARSAMSEGADDDGGAGAAARSPGGSPGGDGFAPSALGTREQ